MHPRYRRMLEGLPPTGEALWFVYMLRCGDGTLYTGITKNVEARLKAHQCGRGAAYTRTRSPVELIYTEAGYSRSDALRREAAIKRLPRGRKIRLSNGQVSKFG